MRLALGLSAAALGLALVFPVAVQAAPEVRTVTVVETRRDHNRRAFASAWEWVNSHYYDATFNGRDWASIRADHLAAAEAAVDEDELYTVIKHMVAELGDHHSQVMSPREVRELGRTQRSLLGFVSRPAPDAADKWTIVGVMPGSPAADAGVKTGWVLASCDGLPPGEVLGPDRPLEAGRAVRCEFSDENEQTRTLTIAAGEVASRIIRESRVLEGGRLYLRFDEFDGDSARWVREQLHTHAAATGLVLDLRFNPGGEVSVLEEIAGEFFPEMVPLGSLVSREGEATTLVSRRADDAASVRGSIAVLVSKESMSCSEILAGALQHHQRALVLGTRTAGMVLGTVGIPLPGGGELQLSVWDYRTPDGRRLEREGVQPDVALGEPGLDPHAGLTSGIEAAVAALQPAHGSSRIE
jgi:carboxyl-terminal processing protease